MKLHWKIIIGITLGLIYAVIISSVSDHFHDLNDNKYYDLNESFIDQNDNGQFDGGWIYFTQDWIKPFGTIFLNLINNDFTLFLTSLSDFLKISLLK